MIKKTLSTELLAQLAWRTVTKKPFLVEYVSLSSLIINLQPLLHPAVSDFETGTEKKRRENLNQNRK